MLLVSSIDGDKRPDSRPDRPTSEEGVSPVTICTGSRSAQCEGQKNLVPASSRICITEYYTGITVGLLHLRL
jgi:hypothetical protein